MSDDCDLVVTSVDPSLRRIGKHKLRRKLISFLAVSLPPVPLSYVTFEAHIKAQCETYYDSVIKEVYESLCSQWNQRFNRVEASDVSSDTRLPVKDGPITISSDDESESEGCGLEEDESTEPKQKHEQEHDQHEPAPVTKTPCGDSISPPVPDGCEEETTPKALTDGELIALKAEKSTKKYTRYLQETYDLIKSIEGTTSCSICSKLKRRIQKFVSLVGQESAIIQQKLAKELSAHRISPKGNLTEAALEKMRMSILIDKLIEISMPDILKGVEFMETNDDGEDDEQGPKENTVTEKKKGKKKSTAEDASMDVTQVDASCSTEPSTLRTKKKRTKKSSSASCESETPSVSERPNQASVNGRCSEKEENVLLKSKKKKKKKAKVEEASMEAPRAKARKISIKVTDSSHPHQK